MLKALYQRGAWYRGCDWWDSPAPTTVLLDRLHQLGHVHRERVPGLTGYIYFVDPDHKRNRGH